MPLIRKLAYQVGDIYEKCHKPITNQRFISGTKQVTHFILTQMKNFEQEFFPQVVVVSIVKGIIETSSLKYYFKFANNNKNQPYLGVMDIHSNTQVFEDKHINITPAFVNSAHRFNHSFGKLGNFVTSIID